MAAVSAKSMILRCAQDVFNKRLRGSSSVSDNTKNATEIAKAWRTKCWELNPNRFDIEVAVHPELNQRVDVLDKEEMCAYEFKVSGKNAASEFYKDIVKIILWNERRGNKINKLVFITEEEWGRKYLDTAMPHAFIKYLGNNGLAVDIEYIKHG